MQELRDGSHEPLLAFIFVLWEVKKVSLWLFLEFFLSFFYLPNEEYKGQQGFVAAIAKFLHTQDSELMTFAFDGDSGASARPVARLA